MCLILVEYIDRISASERLPLNGFNTISLLSEETQKTWDFGDLTRLLTDLESWGQSAFLLTCTLSGSPLKIPEVLEMQYYFDDLVNATNCTDAIPSAYSGRQSRARCVFFAKYEAGIAIRDRRFSLRKIRMFMKIRYRWSASHQSKAMKPLLDLRSEDDEQRNISIHMNHLGKVFIATLPM